MFKIIQKLVPAPPTGLYSPVAPLSLKLIMSMIAPLSVHVRNQTTN